MRVEFGGLPPQVTEGDVVFEEPRRVTVRDGRFADWFGPFEVHAYRFARYREGMREELAVASLPFRLRRDPEALLLAAEVGVGKILSPGTELAVAVAVVIKTPDGGKSHWALVHPASRPDFHRRDGFALILPSSRSTEAR